MNNNAPEPGDCTHSWVGEVEKRALEADGRRWPYEIGYCYTGRHKVRRWPGQQWRPAP